MPTISQPAARVGRALETRGDTVAVAESCTGGQISSRLTDVPGASAYFKFGIITYAYGTKLDQLAVPRELLDEHGAVSKPVVTAMARGIRDRAGTKWGLATTGVAGPTGGSESTPVGTAYVAVAYSGQWGSGESFVSANRYHFDGDRASVKTQITTQALVDLHDQLRDH